MNRNFTGKILIGLCFCLLCFNSHCRFIGKDEYKIRGTGSLRLLDQLGSMEIISSPFQAIRDTFPSIEEEFAGRLKPVLNVSRDRQQTFSFTTQSSILGISERIKPEGMHILLNNRELRFSTEGEKSDVSWTWIDAQRSVNIRFEKGFNPTFKCLIMEEDKALDFDTHFPDAAVTIQITARRNWHPLEMDIRIDGRLIESKTVKRRYQTYAIPVRIPSGIHTVSIKPRVAARLQAEERPTPPRLLINDIQILAQNDLVLFFTPPGKRDELLNGTIRISYLSDRLATGEAHPNSELYWIKNDPSYNLNELEENPEKVKKKISLEDLSLDVLMAPPESEYAFDLDIPPGAAIKFGLGIFEAKGFGKKESVKFAIDTELNNVRSRIYEKVFVSDSRPMREQLVFERVDLKDLAGRKAKLILTTQHESQESHVLSFWHNPVIFQPSLQNPKIILVSLDTLRADHLGCYGYDRNTTPNLDTLAREGVVFTSAYAQSSWTLPSHVSLLYSLNSASHQVYYADQKIDTSLPSIADLLRQSGYQTFAITSGGYVSRIFGFDDGFDWYDEPLDKSKDPLGQFEAERLFAYTAEWLKKNKDSQFFLFLHTYQPHGPYYCPSPWNELFLPQQAEWHKMDLTQFWASRGKDYAFTPGEIANIVALYDGEIRYTDEMLIKPLINLLKFLNIYDETLILITSDHGEEFYEHKGWLHGRALYDESIRVPLIMRFPQAQFKDLRIATKCRSIDIMPTILDIASVKYDQDSIDGQSLMSMVLGKEKNHRSFISDLAHQDVPVPCPALVASNTDNLKVIINKSDKEGTKNIEVYDLTHDPGEKTDRILDYGKVISNFVKMIDVYYRDKKKISRKIGHLEIDEKLREKLRALGYIQ